MTYYAGLDVSLRSTNICIIDDQGTDNLISHVTQSTDEQSCIDV